MDKCVERTQSGSLVKTANDDKKVKLNHIPGDYQTGRNGICFLAKMDHTKFSHNCGNRKRGDSKLKSRKFRKPFADTAHT